LIDDLGRLQGGHVAANGVDFRVLQAGDHGPLALCLHGFPDSAYTWHEILPALAERGYRAVAPFMRGYAPTGLAPDARYDVSALADDAIALHEALGGNERAVIIGHDWGADAAYGAGALAPARWRRVVALAVPPAVLDQRLYSDFEQLKRSFYVFLLQTSLGEEVVGANDMEFIDRLWLEWSPGFDSTDIRALAKASLAGAENLRAAIAYYQQTAVGADAADPYGMGRSGIPPVPPQPTLYLHGERDGCIVSRLVVDVVDHLSPGSRMKIIEGAGHFLQVERPAEVNAEILAFVA
jgi:pimeloyl-ACP methyl ester carboxylesterase